MRSWANRAIFTSPSVWPTDCFGSLANGWSSSTPPGWRLNHPVSLPSRIFGNRRLGLAFGERFLLELLALGLDRRRIHFVAGDR